MGRVSSRNRVTISAEVLREAGIAAGDELRVLVVGPGRLELERPDDFITRWAGALGGVYRTGNLDQLRDEWER